MSSGIISLAPHRLRLAAGVALAVLAGGAGIALTGVSAWLLSRAAEHPPVLYLMVAIVGVRAFGLSRGVFRYLERLVSHDVALRMQSELRQRAYDRLAASTWLGRRGDLLARLVLDLDAVQDLVVRVLLPFVSAALLVVATSTVLTVLSVPAGLLILCSALVSGAALPWLTAVSSRSADARVAPLRAQLAELAEETSSAAPDLAAYSAGSVVQDRLAALDRQLRRVENRSAMVRGVTQAGSLLASGFSVLVGLVIGSHAVLEGSLPPVQLAVLVLTPLALHEVLAGLPAAAQAFTRASTALDRVAGVLAAPPVGVGERPNSAVDGRPGLELRAATLGWGTDEPVLVGLDLTVRPGEHVCLVGPSGSGKTTVAAAVLGLISPRAGSVESVGRVGYLAQDAYLFDTTVAENVRIGRRDASDAEVRSVLSRVGLDLDLERLVGEHGAALSGGEARRLALARLLLDDHQVVVVDEPTEHLDRPTADALLDDLWAATADAATLVISHDPQVAARCDRVVTLSRSAPTSVVAEAMAPVS